MTNVAAVSGPDANGYALAPQPSFGSSSVVVTPTGPGQYTASSTITTGLNKAVVIGTSSATVTTGQTLLGTNGVTFTTGSIESSTDSALTTGGSAEFYGFAKAAGMDLQLVSFGSWMLRPCALDADCTPAYIVSVAGPVVGTTLTATLPSGTASYVGQAVGLVQQPVNIDADNVARFRGTIGLTADFTSGSIIGQIATIVAYSIADDTTPIGVINDIGLSGTLSGASYSGIATVVGYAGTAFDIRGATGGFSGGIYGPSASETAGVFYLSGGANQTNITGSFGAASDKTMIKQFREIATIGTDANGLTASINTTLSGVGGTITTALSGPPNGFVATVPIVTKVSPSIAFVVGTVGGANLVTDSVRAGRTVPELEMSIAVSTDAAVPVGSGGNLADFTDTAALSYSSFGVWSIKPCSNSVDCNPIYAGTFAGAQTEGYQTTSLPTTGTASYSGGATGFVQQPGNIDADNVAAFYGTSALTANFATGAITGGVTGITAYHIDTDAVLGTVNNIGFSATISGSSFSGTTSVTGGAGSAFNISGATGVVNGGFFGPNAQEVAGTFNVIGGANSTSLLGAFGAKQ